MTFLYPKAFKKSKKVSILEKVRRGFVTLSDHCAVYINIICCILLLYFILTVAALIHLNSLNVLFSKISVDKTFLNLMKVD